MVCCVFIFFPIYFLMSFVIFSFIYWLSKSVSIFMYLWIFQFFCCWFIVSFHCAWKDTWYDFNHLKFVKTYCSLHSLSWRLILVNLRRMCILLLLDDIFCTFLRFKWLFKCCASPLFPFLNFHLHFPSITKSKVLKSLPIFVSPHLWMFASYIWESEGRCIYFATLMLGELNLTLITI